MAKVTQEEESGKQDSFFWGGCRVEGWEGNIRTV